MGQVRARDKIERLAYALWEKKSRLGIPNTTEENYLDAERKLSGKDRKFWGRWQA